MIVRKLAAEFGARLVPLASVFAEALGKREATFWSVDGFHPTPAGHGLIARKWLETSGFIIR